MQTTGKVDKDGKTAVAGLEPLRKRRRQERSADRLEGALE